MRLPTRLIGKVSKKSFGPIVDRVDLWVEVPQVDHQKLSDDKIISEQSGNIRKRVIKAREIQKKRFAIGKNAKTKGDFEMGIMTKQ